MWCTIAIGTPFSNLCICLMSCPYSAWVLWLHVYPRLIPRPHWTGNETTCIHVHNVIPRPLTCVRGSGNKINMYNVHKCMCMECAAYTFSFNPFYNQTWWENLSSLSLSFCKWLMEDCMWDQGWEALGQPPPRFWDFYLWNMYCGFTQIQMYLYIDTLHWHTHYWDLRHSRLGLQLPR